MRIESKLLVAVVSVVVLLGGCATSTRGTSQASGVPAVLTPEQIAENRAQLLMKASEVAAKGSSSDALIIYGDLARTNPDWKEPWVKMAKIHFDSANYSQAIVSAEEALQRDKSDRVAESIRAVSGLRVAASSLNGLRDDVELKGSARADAVVLASVMRETLGEEVLVPPEELEARRKAEALKKKKAVPARSTRPSPAAGSGKTSSTGGNPFGSLK